MTKPLNIDRELLRERGPRQAVLLSYLQQHHPPGEWATVNLQEVDIDLGMKRGGCRVVLLALRAAKVLSARKAGGRVEVLLPSTPPKAAPVNFGVVKNDAHKRLAKTLAEALAAKRRLMRKPNLTAWAKCFQQLHIQDRVAIPDITEVLSWYIANLDGRYMPKAYSAQAFRDKFDALAAKMPAQVTVTAEGRKLAVQLLAECAWQTDRATMEQVMSLSYNCVTKLRSRCWRFPFDDGELGALANIIFEQLPNPADFVHVWYHRGRLRELCIEDALSHGNDKFTKWGRKLAAEFMGSPILWDKLIIELNGN